MFSKTPAAIPEKQHRNFWQDETGATAIEYGLIASGIFMAIIIAINAVGSTVSNTFNNVSNGF